MTDYNRQLGRQPEWNLGCYWRHVTCRLSPVLIVAGRRDFLDAEIINFVAQLTPLVKQKLILSFIISKKLESEFHGHKLWSLGKFIYKNQLCRWKNKA